MELHKKLKGLKELQPIEESESRHFKSGRSEGAPYLFYKDEEFCDLMGHEIVFYPNGVLLKLKDMYKDHPTSKSFVFYNNNKIRVVKSHNRRPSYNFETRSNKYLPPVVDIEIKVYENYIYLKETNFETKQVEEQIFSVHTGEKLNDLAKSEQMSIEF